MDQRSDRRGGFYWDSGVPYVSVTNAIGVIDKPQLRYWFGKEVYLAMVKNPTLNQQEALTAPYATSDSAASRGSTIHSLIEAYKKSGVVIDSVPEKYKGYANAFYKWIDEFKPEIVENEKTVISKLHGYAGTLDMIVKKDGKTYLVDFKTNKKGEVYDEVELQASAYKQALHEAGYDVDGMIAVALSEEGNYTQKSLQDKFDIFLKVKEIWVWKNQEDCKKLGYSK